MNELKLSYTTDQNGMNSKVRIEPLHQFGHHNGDFDSRWWSVDNFTGYRIRYVILDTTIVAGIGLPTSNSIHQLPMNLPHHPFMNWVVVIQAVGYQFKRGMVVQKFTGVITVGLGY